MAARWGPGPDRRRGERRQTMSPALQRELAARDDAYHLRRSDVAEAVRMVPVAALVLFALWAGMAVLFAIAS